MKAFVNVETISFYGGLQEMHEATKEELIEDLRFMLMQSYIIEHQQDQAGIQKIRDKYLFING